MERGRGGDEARRPEDRGFHAQDGRWWVGAKRHVVYVKVGLSIHQKHEAVQTLIQTAAEDIERVDAEVETLRAAGEVVPPSIWGP